MLLTLWASPVTVLPHFEGELLTRVRLLDTDGNEVLDTDTPLVLEPQPSDLEGNEVVFSPNAYPEYLSVLVMDGLVAAPHRYIEVEGYPVPCPVCRVGIPPTTTDPLITGHYIAQNLFGFTTPTALDRLLPGIGLPDLLLSEAAELVLKAGYRWCQYCHLIYVDNGSDDDCGSHG